MRVDINGNYRVEDLVVLAQHLAVQLEARGVAAIEGVSIELSVLNATGKRLSLMDDAGMADHLKLEIADLTRPCVGTGTLRVVETSMPSRKRTKTAKAAYRSRRSYL